MSPTHSTSRFWSRCGLIVVCILWLAFAFACWKGERWLNWKLDYGHKVDRRVEALEQRVTALERGHRIVDGVETCTRKDCPLCNQ
jgi:hypothetical protein